MKKIVNASKLVLKEGKWLILFIVSSLLILIMYYFAIELSASFDMFLKANSSTFVSIQILLSILNSILGGLSITFITFLFFQQKKFSGVSSIQSIGSLIFTVGTTGCYVCGTLLLPIAGISSAIGTLPFAGIELKVLALVLFLISLFETAPKILGLCNLDKVYILKTGLRTLRINESFFRNLKYLGFSIFAISGFLLINNFIPREVNTGINETNYICEYQGGN